MSRQLALASAFSVFALAAMALLSPGSARLDSWHGEGATMDIAAPGLTVAMPQFD
jgi:hypothetical protein